jgi:hypothetical protein
VRVHSSFVAQEFARGIDPNCGESWFDRFAGRTLQGGVGRDRAGCASDFAVGQDERHVAAKIVDRKNVIVAVKMVSQGDSKVLQEITFRDLMLVFAGGAQ